METILLWMAGALFAGYLCRLIYIPTIVGFILSGYLFSLYDGSGQSLLDLPSEIGVELLLFSIGLKIKPTSLLNTSLFLVFLMHSSAVFLIFLLLLNLGLNLEIKLLMALIAAEARDAAKCSPCDTISLNGKVWKCNDMIEKQMEIQVLYLV